MNWKCLGWTNKLQSTHQRSKRVETIDDVDIDAQCVLESTKKKKILFIHIGKLINSNSNHITFPMLTPQSGLGPIIG